MCCAIARARRDCWIHPRRTRPIMTRSRKTNPTPTDQTATTVGGITDDDWAEIQRAAVEKAKAGNMHAASITERVRRRWRGPTARLDLPPVTDATSLAAAQAEVIAAAARRDITPQDGLAFAAMLECRRRTLGLVEYEARMTALEKAGAERRDRER